MSDPIVWADIPVVDIARASAFYEKLTGLPVAGFPGESSVAVIQTPRDLGPAVSADLYVGGKPSHEGPTVYFGTNGDIDGMIARALEAGGKLLQEKRDMGTMVGWIAFIEDTEGNKIGLQQPSM